MTKEDVKKKLIQMADNKELKANISAEIDGDGVTITAGGHGVAEILGVAMLIREISRQMDTDIVDVVGMIGSMIATIETVDEYAETEGMPS